MIVVDASVWVSALIESDVHYAASAAWLADWIRSGRNISAPSLMLAEVAGAISRRDDAGLNGAAVISLILGMTRVDWVHTNDSLLLHTAELASNLRLRCADATYVAVAQRYDVSLLTWDRDQAARAGRAVPAATPRD